MSIFDDIWGTKPAQPKVDIGKRLGAIYIHASGIRTEFEVPIETVDRRVFLCAYATHERFINELSWLATVPLDVVSVWDARTAAYQHDRIPNPFSTALDDIITNPKAEDCDRDVA
jgi:hypothetical protein